MSTHVPGYLDYLFLFRFFASFCICQIATSSVRVNEHISWAMLCIALKDKMHTVQTVLDIPHGCKHTMIVFQGVLLQRIVLEVNKDDIPKVNQAYLIKLTNIKTDRMYY